jgi:hypothetical protein
MIMQYRLSTSSTVDLSSSAPVAQMRTVWDGWPPEPQCNGAVRRTDGRYAAGKGHPDGIRIIEATDLDGALVRAGQLAAVTTLPGQVRPLQGEIAA